MNSTSEEGKNGKRAPQGLGLVRDEAGGQFDHDHERELRSIAAFRLRDAANRIALLVGLTRSEELRAELLAMYDRLISEERELLVRPMRVLPLGRSATRAAKRTA